MNLDVSKILSWMIIGVIALIALSLLGLVANLAADLLAFGLKVLVVVLIVALALRFFDNLRTSRTG
jgi:hypothetical protein